ncbi:hypothetical protein STEG23_009795 [Scotinomys teguina]
MGIAGQLADMYYAPVMSPPGPLGVQVLRQEKRAIIASLGFLSVSTQQLGKTNDVNNLDVRNKKEFPDGEARGHFTFRSQRQLGQTLCIPSTSLMKRSESISENTIMGLKVKALKGEFLMDHTARRIISEFSLRLDPLLWARVAKDLIRVSQEDNVVLWTVLDNCQHMVQERVYEASTCERAVLKVQKRVVTFTAHRDTHCSAPGTGVEGQPWLQAETQNSWKEKTEVASSPETGLLRGMKVRPSKATSEALNVTLNVNASNGSTNTVAKKALMRKARGRGMTK